MKDDKDNAFGAFTTEYIRQGPHYYGNGETFLFTFKVKVMLTYILTLLITKRIMRLTQNSIIGLKRITISALQIQME